MKIERKFRITIIAAAMLAAFGNAQADDALIAEYSKPDFTRQPPKSIWALNATFRVPMFSSI